MGISGNMNINWLSKQMECKMKEKLLENELSLRGAHKRELTNMTKWKIKLDYTHP